MKWKSLILFQNPSFHTDIQNSQNIFCDGNVKYVKFITTFLFSLYFFLSTLFRIVFNNNCLTSRNMVEWEHCLIQSVTHPKMRIRKTCSTSFLHRYELISIVRSSTWSLFIIRHIWMCCEEKTMNVIFYALAINSNSFQACREAWNIKFFCVGGKWGKMRRRRCWRRKKSLMISDINSNFIVEGIKENCYNNFKCHCKLL